MKRRPYFVLFVRHAGSDFFTNEAGSGDRASMISEAALALERGAGSVFVGRVELWEVNRRAAPGPRRWTRRDVSAR